MAKKYLVAQEPSCRKRSSRQLIWWIFLIPILFAIISFMLYPVLESFRLSFFKSNGINETFNGIKNYRIVLTDHLFWKSVWNTVYISFFNVGIQIPLSFVLACMINYMRIGKNICKSMYFISYITPAIAASTVFLFVFHPQGILNMMTGFLGIPAVNWLSQPLSAQWAVIIYGIWKTLGFNIIIFIANLQTISSEYYEAATIDGCTPFQAWRYITIPNMKPTIAFLCIMGWIGGLQRFQDVFVFGNGAQGSPERSLFTIVSYIYNRGFGSYEFGVASAASYVLFVPIILFTIINKKLAKLDF